MCKDLEGSGCGPSEGTILTGSWKCWGKVWKSSLRI